MKKLFAIAMVLVLPLAALSGCGEKEPAAPYVPAGPADSSAGSPGEPRPRCLMPAT